jgi:formylglycine-generating enzyme required for sulfatase activity
MGRETYPILCVTWKAAQAFCRFYGGDLPLEVEWAYAALAAARPMPTAYPWGGPDSDLASCSHAVFGRGLASDDVQADACWSQGFGLGPQPVEAGLAAPGDISVGLGIANLGGSASEWMRDDTDPLNSICWMQNTLDLPSCKDPSSHSKQVRGGSWISAPRFVPPARRDGAANDQAWLDTGFRCVREAP